MTKKKILADKDFKEIQDYLKKKGIKAYIILTEYGMSIYHDGIFWRNNLCMVGEMERRGLNIDMEKKVMEFQGASQPIKDVKEKDTSYVG